MTRTYIMKKAATETTCEIVQMFDLRKKTFQSSYYKYIHRTKIKKKKNY